MTAIVIIIIIIITSAVPIGSMYFYSGSLSRFLIDLRGNKIGKNIRKDKIGGNPE